MSNKEIIISAIVLITILVGFSLLIKSRPKPTRKTSAILPEDQLSSEELVTKDNPVSQKEDFQKEVERRNAEAPKAPKAEPKKKAPEMQLEKGVDYKAKIKTNMGEMEIDLYEEKMPITVNNFVALSKSGFYDGLIFHRVINDFMIQGGDPTGTGSGGPGYSFEDEIDKSMPMDKGSLAMANSGPNTNGSQFFIVTKESTPWLQKYHTNFGRITKGIEVALNISQVTTGIADKPLKNVVIEKIEIIED